MSETGTDIATSEIKGLLEAYLRDRVVPHPLLSPCLEDAAVCVTGSSAIGLWDELSALDVHLIVPDEQHARLATRLKEERLWNPSRDFRLRLEDREPFRRFPSAVITILSSSQLAQEFRFELPVALWVYSHAVLLQDPAGTLGEAVRSGQVRFDGQLNDLRCDHYYRFRQARNDMLPRIAPQRLKTVLAIKRGETIREALRLAFLADGRPYPYDKLLEPVAEIETASGAHIVTAVRALVAAREAETVGHAGKVLRDRVAFALQQGGVSERWLEQWWLWPSIAPRDE
ncbi:MAG: hypothetical protein K0Q72_217 [Armatimonadetes bacterium]|jgi:hypothetical protein|nr:hypothetical protein [Armatimonadota bacterium]